MVEITSLRTYPVKSLRGIDLQESKLTIRGLEFDRNWMITDSEWHFLTQRELPLMTTITTAIDGQNLVLKHKGYEDLVVRPDGTSTDLISTKIWRDDCEVHDEGSEASQWLTTILGEYNKGPLRLVRMASSYRRWVGPDSKLNHANSHTALADAYPFLIVAESSLSKVNSNLKKDGAEPVPMNRFRPNIVVKGIEAFSEYNTNDLIDQNGQYSLGLRKTCQRCKITTINQLTGEIANVKEPLKTLSKMNPFLELNGAFFGQYAILLSGEYQTITVGDVLSYTDTSL